MNLNLLQKRTNFAAWWLSKNVALMELKRQRKYADIYEAATTLPRKAWDEAFRLCEENLTWEKKKQQSFDDLLLWMSGFVTATQCTNKKDCAHCKVNKMLAAANEANHPVFVFPKPKLYHGDLVGHIKGFGIDSFDDLSIPVSACKDEFGLVGDITK